MAKSNLSTEEIEGIAEGQAFREEQDKNASQYQSGQALAVDRSTTSKTVVFDIGQWKHKVNVRDFSGYDVKRRENKTRDSLGELVDNPKEAERISDYLLGKKGSGKVYTITDFDSFKKAFKEEFSHEGYAGTRLWDTLSEQEDYLLKIYATSPLQTKVTIDGKGGRVTDLMSKFKIGRSTALAMYSQIRQNEVNLVQKGMLPIDERSSVLPVALVPVAKLQTLSQKIKQGGITYQRSSPRRFTEPQERFLRQNKEMPIKQLTAQFNLVWKDSNKTQTALYFKRYRLNKT